MPTIDELREKFDEKTTAQKAEYIQKSKEQLKRIQGGGSELQKRFLNECIQKHAEEIRREHTSDSEASKRSFCDSCGDRLELSAVFCTACGKRVGRTDSAIAQNKRRTGFGSKKILILVAAIVVVVVAVAFAFVWNGGEGSALVGTWVHERFDDETIQFSRNGTGVWEFENFWGAQRNVFSWEVLENVLEHGKVRFVFDDGGVEDFHFAISGSNLTIADDWGSSDRFYRENRRPVQQGRTADDIDSSPPVLSSTETVAPPAAGFEAPSAPAPTAAPPPPAAPGLPAPITQYAGAPTAPHNPAFAAYVRFAEPIC